MRVCLYCRRTEPEVEQIGHVEQYHPPYGCRIWRTESVWPGFWYRFASGIFFRESGWDG